MGIDAHRGLALWAEGARPGSRRVELVVRDDRGDRVLVRRQVEELLVRERVDLLAGPYSSGLTRAVAPLAETHGVVLWNHGGAADDIHRRGYRMVVGIPTPASHYMLPALRWVTGGPVVILHRAASGFSAAVTRGAEVEAARQGRAVRLEPYPTTREGLENFLGDVRAERPGLLVAAGRLADDVAVARALRGSRIVVPTALVAAGVRAFGEALGTAADGFVGPSQWEPTAPLAPDLGPTPHAFARRFRTRFGVTPDYPAAQAYAAGLIMGRCIEVAGGLDRERLRAAAASLEVTTLFGPFRIDSGTGMQVGHEMLLVEWVRGRRRMIELPPST